MILSVLKLICRGLSRKSCCGFWGWLFRLFRCARFERQPEPKVEFKTVRKCLKTGWLANEPFCPSIEATYVKGTEPKVVCMLHKGRSYSLSKKKNIGG
jgi:hypothetical protein